MKPLCSCVHHIDCSLAFAWWVRTMPRAHSRDQYLLLCEELWRQQKDWAHARLTLLCSCVHCHHPLWVAKTPLLLRAPLQHGSRLTS